MIYTFPILKSFASFLLQNHLDSFVEEFILNGKKSSSPYLKIFGDLPDSIVAKKIKEFYEHHIIFPLTTEKPFHAIEEKIESWKLNVLSIPWEKINIENIIQINSITKRTFIHYIKCYPSSPEVPYELLEELEIFFEKILSISLNAYEEIQKKELQAKDKLFTGILDNIPAFITRVDKTGKISYAAGAGLKTVWPDDQSLAGKSIFEIYSNAKILKKSLEGEAVKFVEKTTSLLGEEREFETFYIPEKDGTLGFSIDITRKKEAESELINLTEGVKDYAIFMLNPDGTVASWNKGAQEFKGYDKAEILGKHFSIFYPKEKQDINFPQYELEEAVKSGRVEDEGLRVRKDGSTFWANVVITPIFNNDKKLLGFTKITRDLTEKRKAEEALRISEDRFRNLIQGVKDYAIFLLSPEGIISSWNEGAQHLKGYSAEEIIGKHFSVFYPEEKNKENFPAYELEQAIKLGRFEDEGYRIRKDGSTFWASVIITAIFNQQKQLIGFSKITRDLTERKLAEETIRRSEERYRLLIDAVKDYAIFMVNPDGIIASWNEGAKRLKGYTENEIIGKHISVFYSQENKDRLYPQYELEQATKLGRFEDQGWRIRKDGTSFFANVIITALFDKKNNLLGFSKITQDLTQRKEYEDRLLHINVELEEKVNKRTEELTTSVRELTKINNDLDNFIYTASHDLKAPVSNIEGLITGLFDELNSRNESDEQLEMFRDLIFSSIKRFQSTLLDLTEIAKVQKESQESNEHIDLKELVEDIQISIHSLIRKNGAEIRSDLGRLPKISFVRKNLKSIFYNLISNGIKYKSEDRKPVIELSSYKDGDFQVITFTDNGLGIKAENKQKMFTMFKRFHDHVEGSGIGLYIVKRIIDNAGGRIEIDSQEGQGTTFTVYLPLPVDNGSV